MTFSRMRHDGLLATRAARLAAAGAIFLNPGATRTSCLGGTLYPSDTTAATVRPPGRRDETDVRCAPTESESHLARVFYLLTREPSAPHGPR